MKKLLFGIAVSLPCLLAHSQEANELGKFAELDVVTRLDINPSYSAGNFGFDHGNSSIYTLFESTLSEHLSLTIANHWLQAGGDYAWPYRNLGRSDETNWLDYCYADLSFGGWTFSLGKQIISTGGWEFEDWDWDFHTAFASPLYDGLACYQWGATAAWTTPSEKNSFSLQMLTSPFGEHPFSSGLWSYSAAWRGEYDIVSTIWSVSAIQYEKASFNYLISLGQKFQVAEDMSITLDWSNTSGFNPEFTLAKGNTLQLRADFTPWDQWDIELKGIYIPSSKDSILPNQWLAGGVLQFYPLRESKDLILHAYAAYNSLFETTTLSIGARYNLRIKLF